MPDRPGTWAPCTLRPTGELCLCKTKFGHETGQAEATEVAAGIAAAGGGGKWIFAGAIDSDRNTRRDVPRLGMRAAL